MKASSSLKEEIERNREKYERDRSRDRESRDSRGSRDREQYDRNRERDRSYTSAHTNSDNPKLLNSRVFIGNLPSDRVTRSEIEEIYSKYGKLLGISILRGFGFVQFENEADAREAVREENGGLIKGNRVDVKMAAEGRKQAGGRGAPASRGHRSPPRPSYRDRSPVDDYRDRDRDRRDPRDDFRRDHRDDPYRRSHDPYGPDPMHVSRRDPFLEPRDMFRDRREPLPIIPREPVAVGRPPVDCSVILMSRKGPLRSYGESIEGRLRRLNMLVSIEVLPEDIPLSRELEECARKRLIYAIVITDENEIHRSLTLNIFHGTPQEHRNMPLDQAIALMGRHFESYMLEVKEKAVLPVPVIPVPMPAVAMAPVAMEVPSKLSAAAAIGTFQPPNEHTAYLLNLLADNRFLSVDELSKVIDYLVERRTKLLESQGGRPPVKHGLDLDGDKDEKAIAQQQQELQSKILSILGKPESSAQQQDLFGSHFVDRSSVSPPAQTPVPPPVSIASSINFDNPNVQKALDNLISSGPNLLKSISAVTSSCVGMDSTSPSVTSYGNGGMQVGVGQHGHTSGYGVSYDQPQQDDDIHQMGYQHDFQGRY